MADAPGPPVTPLARSPGKRRAELRRASVGLLNRLRKLRQTGSVAPFNAWPYHYPHGGSGHHRLLRNGPVK